MKLTCPSCGAVASAEAWGNDATWRELLAAIAGLPAPLPPVALGYLGLFRPEKSALSPARALRISRDLAALVAPGHVQVQGKAARPCPASLWAQGIEQMMERRAALQLPLKNHNYLRQIVHALADQADAARESQLFRRHDTELNSQFGSCPRNNPPDADGMSELMRKVLHARQK